MKSGSSQERQLLCVHEGSVHPVSWTLLIREAPSVPTSLVGLDIYAEPVTFDLQGELSPVQRSWLCAELEELWVVWCVFNKLASRAESLVWDGWCGPWISVWPASSSPTPALASACSSRWKLLCHSLSMCCLQGLSRDRPFQSDAEQNQNQIFKGHT